MREPENHRAVSYVCSDGGTMARHCRRRESKEELAIPRIPPDAPQGVRRVTETEADRVTELFTLAFQYDLTWGWAFPDPD